MACAGSVGDGVGFVGSWNVVKDPISIVDAHFPGKERGVRYRGFSYGSVLGLTLASLFPDRVERVVDGIIDLDDYYSGRWERNLQDRTASWGNSLRDPPMRDPSSVGRLNPRPSRWEQG